MDHELERLRAVEAVKGWIGTPYHHNGRVKGAGADCLTSLAGPFEDAGLTPHIEIPYYPHDWHLHHSEEKYLDGLSDWCVEVGSPPDRSPLPGDIVLWKFGRCFSHGAIVIAWPRIAHAYLYRKYSYDDVERSSWLNFVGENSEADKGKRRARKFFTLKRWVD